MFGCFYARKWLFLKRMKTLDLTLVSQYPRLTLAVWYLMFQAATKSINRCQARRRSKQREGEAATRPPAAWPGGIWTHPPKPQRSCSLNHSAWKKGESSQRCMGTAAGLKPNSPNDCGEELCCVQVQVGTGGFRQGFSEDCHNSPKDPFVWGRINGWN